MKMKAIALMALAGFLVFLGAHQPQNPEEKEKILIQTLISGLSQVHYKPAKVDDAFSKSVFEMYLKRTDGNKRFFLQSDIDELMKYEMDLDDQTNSGSFDFFNESLKILNERIEEAQGYYREILSRPFDFDAKDVYEYDGDKIVWAADREVMKDYWRKMLQYRTMTRISDMLKEQEKKQQAGEEVEIKTFEELEAAAREKELEADEKWFKRIGQLERSDRLTTYLNCITSVFDPHTTYLPPQDKENFDIGMSGRLEGIGARLQNDGEETKVVSIVPGSASWRQGELQVNDVILKVAQKDEEPVDVLGMRLDDVVDMIRGKKGTEVSLTVKKVDGKTKVISIVRDVVVIEEGYAKSSILELEGVNKKLGYIYLPRFYADFNSLGGKNSGKDVKNELSKLLDEGSEGIILDLRNNPGGSLPEVIEMAGLFIEKGPIVQVRSRYGKPEVKFDPDPSVHYDGPLVLLVNSGSASAAEILAAALQDYGRAVIIGSPTYGKGSVQRFLDLDQAVPSSVSGVKPLGFIKFTTQMYYRINGKTVQLNGVIPDIIIPDNYIYLDSGEKDYEFAMLADEIDPADFKFRNDMGGLNQVAKSSMERIRDNSFFNVIDENAHRLKDEVEKTTVPLNFKDYQEKEKEDEAWSKKFEDLEHDIAGLKILSLKQDMTKIGKDSVLIAQRQEWHKNLKKDIYLEEAISVMKDLMKTEAYAHGQK